MPSHVLSSVIGWLRAGYPQGVPPADYVPLIALLSRRLTGDEVSEIAAELGRTGEVPVDSTDIGTLITKVTNEMPRQEDVARVQARLAQGGWPLADPRIA